jgi:signal transduction histidine kinase
MVKTRVQLWQRSPKRAKRSSAPKKASAITGESMNLVVSDLDRMESILKKLQVFSKVRNLRLRPVDVHTILDETLMIMRPQIRKHRTKVKKSFQLSDGIIDIDPLEMKEVFLNLFSNSIEAMSGRGTLTLTTMEKKPGDVCIIIEDTGPGVPPQHASKIFDPFFTTKETGIGLGLSIAYEIVRAHGGSLEYSPDGQGARFIVLLTRGARKGVIQR